MFSRLLLISAFCSLAGLSGSAQTPQEPAPPTGEKLAPYYPTPETIVDRMLELGDLKAGEKMFDLGSGDGRIVIMAARKYHSEAVGVELDNDLVIQSTTKIRQQGLQKTARIIYGDILKQNYSSANLITIYLLPESNILVRPILESQLKKGTRIVAHDFEVEGWTPVKTVTIPDDGEGRSHTLFSLHPVRIGITCYPTYGGSGIVATELGLELANRGHDIHFITYANPIRLDAGIERIHYHEVEVSTYPLFQYQPYCLALASRMADVAQTYSLDLLHVHYAIPHSISALLARQMLEGTQRVPFITTLHGTDITLVGVDRSYFGITKFSIEQSNGITAISEDLRRDTVESFGVENEIRVIHNFVNCETYQPDPDRRGLKGYAPAGEKLLIHLSNFRPVKRVLDCIRILAKVREHAAVRLLMVGDGPDRGAAEHLATTLGVRAHVDFLGKQDHVERLIPLAHVLVMPSEMESFGLAALEAMACGVPPVATRVGGVPELITDGEDGFLKAPGDIDGLAERAIQLVTDERLHEKMAAAARNTALTRFCTDRLIPQYEAYYKQVLLA